MFRFQEYGFNFETGLTRLNSGNGNSLPFIFMLMRSDSFLGSTADAEIGPFSLSRPYNDVAPGPPLIENIEH